MYEDELGYSGIDSDEDYHVRIGLAQDGEILGWLDDELGWFGAKIFKAVKTATLAPIKLAVDVAKGKRIDKAVKSFMLDPIKAHVEAVPQAKKILKSPILKSAAGIAAIVYPPVGVPLAAGLAVADKVLKAAEGTLPAMKTCPPIVAKNLRAAAKQTIAATYTLAARGNADAKRGLQTLVAARRGQKQVKAIKAVPQRASVQVPAGGKHQPGIFVSSSGHVVRGAFSRVA